MLLTSTTLNGAVSNDSNNNITMSVGNTVIANVNSSGIFFESGKKAIYTGAVLQVVSVVYATSTTIASDTYVDTGLSASITPSSTSSKILVITSQSSFGVLGNNSGRNYYVRLVRGSTALAERSTEINATVGSNGFKTGAVEGSWSYLDSPNTTSSTTYKSQAKVSNTADTCQIRFQWENMQSSIILLEIAG